jgi:hypothetical protein
MRIKIVQQPPIVEIDGIRLDSFEVGLEYEVGNTVAAVFLAEGWAEPTPLDAPRPVLPFTAADEFDSAGFYRRQQDLVRQFRSAGVRPSKAADKPRKKSRR